jgi:transposase
MAQGQWTEVDARGVLAALEKGGLSVVEFARERCIVPQRIYWGQRKLADKDAESGIELLPVPLTDNRRSGHIVKVGRGFDEEAVGPGRACPRDAVTLGLPPAVKIHFAASIVDMRQGIDGLRALVEQTLKKDLYEGRLFVFVGKTKDKVKILFWDRSGFVLYLKRLEKGGFQLPVVDALRRHVEMDAAQLAMLLDGIDLNARRLTRCKPQPTGIGSGRNVCSNGDMDCSSIMTVD